MGRSDEMIIDLPSGGKSDSRSDKQEDQLTKAREVALKNRRQRLRAKLEARLKELHSQLADSDTGAMEGAVKLLIELEDRHRSKQAALTEQHTAELRDVKDELARLKSSMDKFFKRTTSSSSSVASSSAPSTRLS